jgi:hypothetical protein
MKPITKTLKLTKKQYFETHLNIVNSLLPIKLTEKEIEVLGIFLTIPKDFRFTQPGKKIVRDKLNISHQGLSNYLIVLMKKGFIVKNKKDEYIMLPFLECASNEQTYNFKIVDYETSQS